MEYNIQRYIFIIFSGCLLTHHTMQSMGSALKVIGKGIEIAGHIGTAVDTAMGIASVGVTLWGNDKDKERMNKAIGITSIMTSLARGDLSGAQDAAEALRGSKDDSIIYQPLLSDELADADIVPTPPTIHRRRIGDITIPKPEDLSNAKRKTVSIEDLKVVQFPEAKNQLVFIAKDLPYIANQSTVYTLLNGIEILFTTQSVENDKATIIIKKLISGKETSSPKTALEIGTIKCSFNDLNKGLFVGTTNGELSIFFKDGNLIKKTILIKNMNQ